MIYDCYLTYLPFELQSSSASQSRANKIPSLFLAHSSNNTSHLYFVIYSVRKLAESYLPWIYPLSPPTPHTNPHQPLSPFDSACGLLICYPHISWLRCGPSQKKTTLALIVAVAVVEPKDHRPHRACQKRSDEKVKIRDLIS